MRSGNWTVSIVGNEWWIKGYYQNWLHLSSGIKCEVHHGKHANITDLNQQSQWLTNQCHVTIHPCQTAYANHALQTFLTLPLLLLLLLNWLRKKHTIQPIIIKLDKTINLMFAQKCCQSPTFSSVICPCAGIKTVQDQQMKESIKCPSAQWNNCRLQWWGNLTLTSIHEGWKSNWNWTTESS